MKQEYKNRLISGVITLLFMLLLFLLLLHVSLYTAKVLEDEGIEVALGVIEQAGGYQAEQSESVPEVATVTPPPAPAASPSANDLLTQEDESPAQLPVTREDDNKRRQEMAEAERLRREQEQADKLAKERAEQKAAERAKAEAERRQRETEAIAKAGAFASLFGNNNSNADGSGDTQGSGQKGNPIGHGSVGGNIWSLDNRDLKTLPPPSNNFTQEGKVVVAIIVDANGKVVSAQPTTGTTISDDATRQLAVRAALKAEFSSTDRPDKQFGTITYIFKFK